MTHHTHYYSSQTRQHRWGRVWLAVRKRMAHEKIDESQLAALLGMKERTVKGWFHAAAGGKTTDRMEEWAKDWL